MHLLKDPALLLYCFLSGKVSTCVLIFFFFSVFTISSTFQKGFVMTMFLCSLPAPSRSECSQEWSRPTRAEDSTASE